MSFQVGILQRPMDREAAVVTTDMSTDSLQLQLNKDMRNLISINGYALSNPQKVLLRRLGYSRGIVSAQGHGLNLHITAKIGGRLRECAIDPEGKVAFLDDLRLVSYRPYRARWA